MQDQSDRSPVRKSRRGRTAPREKNGGQDAAQSGGRDAAPHDGTPKLSTPTTADFATVYADGLAPLLNHSEKMRAVREIVEQVADSSATVLIRGESGVGKDLIARALVASSGRPDQPFIKVNCAALPGELLESELFGHEKGAFTGAYQRKLGKFEFANHGTLFLDEIGELPLALQAKLLHVLQDLEFFRLGGRDLIQVDTRIIASTNRELEPAILQGHFREDLYYRLAVVEIHVPPLRERRDEIPALVAHFVKKFEQETGRSAPAPPELKRLFVEYDWPGNIREMENVIRRLVVLGHVPRIVDTIIATLTAKAGRRAETAVTPPLAPQAPSESVIRSVGADSLRTIARRAAQEAERKALREILPQVRWNRTAAARVLHVSYKTLLQKIAEYGIS